MHKTQATLILDTRDVVGESMVWDERRSRLVWVDIIGRRIHLLDPVSGAHETWPTPDLVTSIGLRQDGGAIVGLRKEIALWDFGGPFRRIATIDPDRPDTRLNEGVVAPDGSFWVGTMANNIGPDDAPVAVTGDEGRLYRVDAKGAVTALSEDRFGITNTMAWLPDGRFVTADTMKNALYSYRWDRKASRLAERLPFFTGFERGLPDGSCLDAQGYVWNCRVVGGSCLARIGPEGRLDGIVELPCSWPTSCAFGGAGLDTLFVTSARFTMSAGHLAANPSEGGLFALKPGVRGVPANRFG
ncbi:SMP-30/gluconolactonase/LRE family protein [Mesorhizobium sp.]|uniref:SMP-30/gluconolactonase/LRE family protein n=1 Tax=Mesorhizobium sp. TaxID=1871066 RepID=UPI000FE36559|nr:SMP-30/gluconolactonase/LRE family protein [Mesorhizobium sp.]RWH68558.1 MAG: SMP-30/gluconolactonase/LRE family protein [Mesorhizobium sp.]RWL24798.1 MAG: SMP-30/gluconolactonase/LRE family protein [Mesorhizobium sp.]RWL27272.1 MAG: SMP-30/gluconolactonase/LRE family protein [Mesorhizobium sp.]RWL32236.1 MAG: SMP-30/gluconolactonase/LRE family protein [Mesorhizobium sp.]RWL49515.1 MAG: SMP-30/gluconolactonase/LRE family protein [Mesorhizobium sp.]